MQILFEGSDFSIGLSNAEIEDLIQDKPAIEALKVGSKEVFRVAIRRHSETVVQTIASTGNIIFLLSAEDLEAIATEPLEDVKVKQGDYTFLVYATEAVGGLVTQAFDPDPEPEDEPRSDIPDPVSDEADVESLNLYSSDG